jgi:YggT family protein
LTYPSKRSYFSNVTGQLPIVVRDPPVTVEEYGSMYIVGYFLMAAAKVMDVVLLFFMWVVIARAILSWVNPDPYNAIVRFINNVTEPVLYPIRSKLPINFGGIDFSPIIVFLVVIFLRTFVVNSLMRIAASLI